MGAHTLPPSAASSSSTSPLDIIPSTLAKCRQRVYSIDDLEPFEMLSNAIWIFDVRNKCMFWANPTAVEFWGADTLQSLLDRDFAKGMSKAAEEMQNYWLEKYHQGETNNVTWTFHPNGGKDGPKTCEIVLSGIYVSNSNVTQKFCQLCEVRRIEDANKDVMTEEQITTKRRMEMLRHVPSVARQFNLQGNLMEQNGEALGVFGLPPSHSNTKNNKNKNNNNTATATQSSSGTGTGTGTTSSSSPPPNKKAPGSDNSSEPEASTTTADETSTTTATTADETSVTTTTTTTDETSSSSSSPMSDFLSQFVDVEEGQRIWDTIKDAHDNTHREDISTEILQHTLHGQAWFSICVRAIQDAVTSEPVVLYSARDISGIMQSAKEEAEKHSRDKHEFFAVMAHEIRTPLHQVVGFIELLADSKLTEDQKDSVQMMQSSAQTLIAIINDVLDFTKLEAGKMKLENIPFEVRGVIDGCLAAVQRQMDSKGLIVSNKVDRSIPIKIIGDPNRLRQILSNMLTNAVKFTSDGELEITAEKRRKSDDGIEGQVVLYFSVRDTGIGMSETQQSLIFNPYQQADVSVSRKYGGTGLGLAICKSLVESMGGTIGVKSKEGDGSTFWFEIPFGRYAKPQEKESIPQLLETDAPPSSYRILVAEDNKINQKVVKKMVEKLGHMVVIAENGQLAIDAIESGEQDGTPFDMVLMDWQMPVMDGIDATKEIRNRGYDVVIIGLTASIQGLDWRQVGMNDCLKKPTRIGDLRESISRNMRNSG